MADTLSFIPETPASMSDQLTTTPTPTSSSVKKLALAEHRYGREEMLSLYQENPPLPSRISRIPDLVRTEATQPLALIPLTEQEQLALAGTVNSHSVYGMRGGGAGRGFYPARGGPAGRGGRRPRQDPYWPTTPDETRGGAPSSLGAAYYQRQSSEPYRGADSRPDGPGSRASRDTNWRFSSGTTPTGDGEDGGGWGKHWHSSATSPVKPVGGRWREGGSGWKEQRWQALPEWATDESTSDGGGKEKGKENRTGSAVGSFDTSGNFTMSEREADEKEEADQFPEDVFEEEPVASEKDTSSHVSKQEERPPSPLQQPLADKRTASERVAGSSVASSGDSMEEMARRFEKAAEAVLSTDEETPSPLPNISSQFFPNTQEQKQQQLQQHKQKHGQQQQQHNQKQPKQAEKQQVEKNALPSVDMTSWVYCDPQGDMQGPFTNQEMHDWFRAGYFTMDLMVRRLCDVVMLPLGQVITAWGRVPFAPGPPMPAMQSTDPYLRQLLQQPLQKQPQVKLAQPDSHHKDSVKVLSSAAAASSDPIASSQSPASLLWGLAPESPTNEEQWPELFSSEKHSSTPHQSVAMVLEDRRDEEEKRNEKERKRLKDQAQAEEKKRQEQLEEEIKRKEEKRKKEEKKLAEERKRLEMERQAEIKREEEEKRLLEQERKRIEEEMFRAAEKRREAELLRQQREYEEAQKRAEEEERKREEMQLALSPHHRGWNTAEQELPSPRPLIYQQQQQPTPSLLQIQREEQIIAEKERRQMEELRMLQQYQQSVPIGGGWGSMAATGGSRPTSFLDIQKEQQGGGNKRQTKSNVPAATPPPPHQSFSWSKVACTTNKQQPTSNQPTRQQPPQKKPTATVVESNKAVAAFWEEAALESDAAAAAYNTKSTAGSKEEERVRKLFTTSTDEVLTNWCADELAKFDVDVDPATFVSLLLEVESTYEVHDYIRSFLGETDEVHAFAKQFLDNRQKLKKNQQKKGHQKKVQVVTTTAVPFVKGATVNSSVVAEGGTSSARAAKKKNKKKMQKVHPSAMLGFTVNAAERPNAGEIQSAKDAV